MLWPQPGAERKFVWGGACMSFQREPRTAAGATQIGAVRAPELSPRVSPRGTGGEAAGTFLVRACVCSASAYEAAAGSISAWRLAVGGARTVLRTLALCGRQPPDQGMLLLLLLLLPGCGARMFGAGRLGGRQDLQVLLRRQRHHSQGAVRGGTGCVRVRVPGPPPHPNWHLWAPQDPDQAPGSAWTCTTLHPAKAHVHCWGRSGVGWGGRGRRRGGGGGKSTTLLGLHVVMSAHPLAWPCRPLACHRSRMWQDLAKQTA